MNESEVLDYLDLTGTYAGDLLLERMPSARRRFNALCKSMKTLLEDVQKEFPDATYYTAGGGFSILLGRDHSEATGRAQSELSALSYCGVIVGDGDY